MKRKLVLLAGVAAIVAALVAPSSALAGADQTATVRMGTKKENDANEFRFSSKKVRSAAFGEPSLLQAGPTTFTFVNRGNFPHNFVVVERTTGATTGIGFAPIDPGAKTTVTVDLRPGSYIAACTVFGGFHWSQGMITSFTVGTLNGETGVWE